MFKQELVEFLEGLDIAVFSQNRPINTEKDLRNDVDYTVTEEEQLILIENPQTRFRFIFVKVNVSCDQLFKFRSNRKFPQQNNARRRF